MRKNSKSAKRQSSSGWRAGAAPAGLLSCCIAALLISLPAIAQPESDQPSRPADDAAAPAPDEARQHALERLDNRLNWTRRMLKRFEEAEARMVEAKGRIQAGEDPEPIMQELRREAAPDFRREPSPPSRGVHIQIRQHDRPDQPKDENDEAKRRWRDRHRPEGPERFPPATPEQKYRVDQVLDTVVPDLSQRLKVICETQPERCEQEYARLAYRMRETIQDGVADQALFDLRLEELRVSARVVIAAKHLDRLQRQRESLVEAGQAVPDDLSRKIAESEKTLEALIAEQLDVRTRIREEERAKLQRELERIQSQIRQLDRAIAQEQDRERIVREQMAEALEQARQGRDTIAELREQRRESDDN